MRKIMFLAILSAILISTSAFAYSITPGDWVKVYTGTGGTYAGYYSGAINLYETNQTGATSDYAFQTFCVEFNEHIYVGTPTYVRSISNAADAGGGLGPGATNYELSNSTQWLYYNFIAGTLDDAGYLSGFAYGNADSYNALQQAIWYYEGEINLASANLLATSFINAAQGKSADGTVQVMNLLSGPGGDRRQDLLIVTPEPLSLLLLGFGLMGVAAVRRKVR
jgi:hypothetical protein